ncbi:hypothetical protein BDR26DRAFT_849476 [Obelidium mucronatum]|nr:hypothetical protein BDR26DRAFT_849476 [Obelidium mucronatum]
MGPKPKGKGKKDKKEKAAKTGNPGELDSQEKLNKSGLEIDTLLKELEHHNELNYRLKSANWHMSRQYKSMQSEMTARINSLESQVADLKAKLAASQTASQEATKEFIRIIAIKDEVIEEQNVKMSYMSSEFESMLNETLQKMSRKLDIVSNRWKENDNMQISEGNSRKLGDFQLNRLIHRQDQ